MKEYETRLRLLASNRADFNHFTVPARMAAERMNKIQLSEFVAWALQVEYEGMPTELMALAVKPKVVPKARRGGMSPPVGTVLSVEEFDGLATAKAAPAEKGFLYKRRVLIDRLLDRCLPM